MNNLFLSYDLSERLRKLGFDEDCFACYPMRVDKNLKILLITSEKDILDDSTKAPLWQQALTWINEKLVIKGLETIKFDGFLKIGLEETLIKLNTAIELCEKEI